MSDDPELTALYNAGVNFGHLLMALALGGLAAAIVLLVIVLA